MILLLLTSFSLSVQRDCGSIDVLEQQIQADAGRLDRMDQLEAFTRNFRAEAITATGGFGTNVQVRFRCDASTNSDYVHLDNIVLGGCQSNGTRVMIGNNNRETTAFEADELDDEAMDVDHQVFPNPATGHFNVRIDEEGYTARLTGMTGRVITEQKLTVGINRIAADKLPAGMYLLVIEGADGYREVEKVILK